MGRQSVIGGGPPPPPPTSPPRPPPPRASPPPPAPAAPAGGAAPGPRPSGKVVTTMSLPFKLHAWVVIWFAFAAESRIARAESTLACLSASVRRRHANGSF